MRLVDADNARECFGGDGVTGAVMKRMFDSLPTIDAVPVVRRPVPGYEGYYEVDNLGRVFSVDRIIHVNDNGRIYDKPVHGAVLKQTNHSRGYKTVPLTKNGKDKAGICPPYCCLCIYSKPGQSSGSKPQRRRQNK